MRPKKLDVICCPKCGREYLPAEIFLPKEFLGNPDGIMRDYSGKIIDFLNYSMNLKEKYVCDSCDTPFKVTANVSFKTFVDKEGDFNEYYSTPLYEQFNLFED